MMYLVLMLFLVLVLVYIKLWYDDTQDKKLLETVTNVKRGTKSERRLVLTLLKSGVHSRTIFHDLYVRKHDGNFSQIDIVVVTRVGLLVFEVKDYSGWIFGSGKGFHWTQVLAYGETKYKMYNPVEQNRKHIIALRNGLPELETVPFYSIIVFFGNSELKKIEHIPENTYVVKYYEVLGLIKAITDNVASAKYGNKQNVVDFLKEAVKNGDDVDNQIRHSYYVRSILGEGDILND